VSLEGDPGPKQLTKPSGGWAGLFELVCPGLGYLYRGYPIHTVAVAGGLVFVFVVAALSDVVLSVVGFWVVAILLIASRIFSIGHVWWLNDPPQGRSYGWVILLVFALASLLLWSFLLEKRAQWLGYAAYSIPSDSMSPSLQQGDRIAVDADRYRARLPSRGDIVVFHVPHDSAVLYVKRVVGLPGESIEVIDGRVSIDGSRLDEPYLYWSDKPAHGVSRYQLTQEQFLLLGDNRNHSLDSRHFGPIEVSNMVGKARHIWFSTRSLDRVAELTEPHYANTSGVSLE